MAIHQQPSSATTPRFESMGRRDVHLPRFSHQMIWHSTVLVGCASALCPPSVHSDRPWPFYVCNYITG